MMLSNLKRSSLQTIIFYLFVLTIFLIAFQRNMGDDPFNYAGPFPIDAKPLLHMPERLDSGVNIYAETQLAPIYKYSPSLAVIVSYIFPENFSDRYVFLRLFYCIIYFSSLLVLFTLVPFGLKVMPSYVRLWSSVIVDSSIKA